MKRRWANCLRALMLALFLILAAAPASRAQSGPLRIDLNGAEQGIDYSTNFIENTAAPKVIVSEDLTITNERDRITGARVKITNANRPDSAVESLGIGTSVAGLTVKYSAATGELTITGTRTPDEYEQALRSLTYFNTSDSPDTTDRIVSVTVSDGANVSPPATITITVVPVNDAPELDPDCAMTLASIDEDSSPTNGRQVQDIISSGEQEGGRDCITDKDKGDPEGFAVVEVGSANGVWQYSTAGTIWTDFGAVSATSAVVLNGTARIRFLAKPNFNGSSSFSVRAWDLSDERPSGTTGVDTSLNGGTTPFSATTAIVTIQILSVNDLPIVDLNGGEQGTDYSTQFFINGSPVPIANFKASITDPDHNNLAKLTVTLTTRPDGSSESLLIGAVELGAISIEPYSPGNGRLVLNGPAPHVDFERILRTITYDNAEETPATSDRTVTVVANDGVSDGPSSTTTIAIRPPNHAPVLDSAAILTLPSIEEDAVDPVGAQISQILASGGGDPITDLDDDALEGIAVIGADVTNGQWEYSTMNPPVTGSWLPVGTVAPNAARLLNDSAWLRFVPAADYYGPTGPLTFRAWDRTFGGNGQPNIDTLAPGGNTAFSVNTNSINGQVTPVNDAPLLGGIPTAPLLYVEDSPPLVLAEQLTLTDPDSPNLASATVRLTNPLDGNAEWLLVDTGGTAISSSYSGGVLQLTGAASPAVYQQVLRTVAYRNTSLDPESTGRVIEWSASDGQAARPPVMMTINVQPVNNPPELDLDGIGPNLDYSTVFYINRGPVPIVAPSLVLIDHDNTTIQSATIRITNVRDGSAELLSADTGAAGNISSDYDPETGTLNLTGVDSVANYQRVLRTVAYDNNRSEPNTENRIVEFVVADALSISETRRSTVAIVVAPNVHLYMPLTAWMYRRAEEPNDHCSQAMEVYLNTNETFRVDDQSDWFYFDLPSAARVTVELRDFMPEQGQIQVHKEKTAGQGCGVNSGNLEQIGFNGDKNTPTRIIDLGQRPPGRYYVWVITDGEDALNTNYRLTIRTR